MKRILSVLLAVSMLFGCVALLASCGAPDNDGAEISVYLGESVYDFDPSDYYVENNAEQVLSLLYEPLFKLNDWGNIENAAASWWGVDEGERTIRIELRESYWSDAIRVTAEDFVFAWTNLILEPNNANPAAALLYDIENAYEIKKGDVSVFELGAVATGTYELTITYREGADYRQLLKNLASVATSPIRQDVVTDFTQGYWSKAVNSAVTNGPFRLNVVDPDSFTLSRNEGYHQLPTVENPTTIVTPNKLVTFHDAANKDFKITYKDLVEKTVFYMGDASLKDRKDNKDTAIVADDLSTYTYVFNTDKPLFAIKEVRQALSMAVDREAIISAITFGKAATGFLPENVLDINTGKSFREGDAAKLISTTAKLKEANALLKNVDFTGIDKSITLTVADNVEAVAIANLVKAAWEKLDCKFKVTVEKVGVITKTVNDFSTNSPMEITDSELQVLVNEASRGNRDFDVIGIDWQMYSTDAFVALSAFAKDFSGCGKDFKSGVSYGSFGGYSNKEYDKLIKAAYDADNKATRSEKLYAAEKLLLEDAAVMPLVFNQTFAFVSEDLYDVSFDGFGNVVFTRVSQKDYEKYLGE